MLQSGFNRRLFVEKIKKKEIFIYNFLCGVYYFILLYCILCIEVYEFIDGHGPTDYMRTIYKCLIACKRHKCKCINCDFLIPYNYVLLS